MSLSIHNPRARTAAADRPLIDAVELSFPELPAGLEGLRILHLTDFHVRRRRRRFAEVVENVRGLEVDLAVLTGDFMSHPGDEAITVEILREVCEAISSRQGVFGVFGNHDLPVFCDLAQSLPVTWLVNDGRVLAGRSLLVMGLHMNRLRGPDAVEMLRNVPGDGETGRAFKLLLCHHPCYLPVAADLGVDLMLSGHTHGGQCRLPPRQALVNSSDLPLGLTSGLLRLNQTIAAVSRGVGETMVNLRVFCPPQIPVYRLTRGALPGEIEDGRMVNVRAW